MSAARQLRAATPKARLDAAWVADRRNRASVILAAPPAKRHIVRTEPVGFLVASFVLPLELCLPLNRFAELQGYARKRVKDAALLLMLSQRSFERARQPLPGRPHVRAVRFSSVEVDRDSGWAKVPVDRLVAAHGGLGLIVDDRPSLLDLACWWEPAPPKAGFVLVELYTGAT